MAQRPEVESEMKDMLESNANDSVGDPLLLPPEGNGSVVENKDTTKIEVEANSPSLKLFNIVKTGQNRQALKELLISCNLADVDADGKSVLHHSVKFPNRKVAVEMTEDILNHWKNVKNSTPENFVNIQVDNHHHHKLHGFHHHHHKQSALHLAAECASEKIVILLCNFGADLTLSDDKDQTPLDLIYINLPRLTLRHFNRGVKYDSSHEKIEVDFNTLTNIRGGEDFGKLLQETRSFEGLLKEEPETVKEVLNHPLMQAFLYFKYKRAYPLIIASIFIHIFWHAIYAYFIFNVYYTNCPWISQIGQENDTEKMDSETLANAEINCDPSNFQPQELGLAITCWILGILFFAKELFEMVTVPSWSRYFLELENVGQLLVILSVFWTSWPIYEFIGGVEKIGISPWQYKLACVTVFIVWSLVLGQVCKIQQLRILIEIFIKVFKSFFKFICTFASLLFAFAFSFCIIMPQGKAFKSPWLAVPKVLVMMTGELNYDDVFHTDDSSTGVSPSHYMTTQILFSLFTILMSMILLNLLIGLAVTDTQELRANCHSAELSSMLEEIFLLESFGARVYKVLKIRWFLDTLSIRRKLDETKKNGWMLCKQGVMSPMPGKEGLKYSYSFAKNEKYPFPSGLMEHLRHLADLNAPESASSAGEKFVCANCNPGSFKG